MAIIYVDINASGASDGSSWGDAYTDLQAAIAQAKLLAGGYAVGEVQIWVAAGTYTPGSDRSDTFTIDAGFHLYGGFNGSETALDQRDYDANLTILSGELGNDFGDPRTDNNAYHVVTTHSMAAPARIDGVIIQEGSTENLSGNDDGDDGAGIYNQYDGQLILANVVIQNNAANDDGGGIRNDGTLTIINSTIHNNTSGGTSDTSGGGGLINTVGSTAVIINSTFSNNTSGKNGGAIRNDGTMTIFGSTLSGNTANESGGAIVNTIDFLSDPPNPASLQIISSTITENDSNNASNSGGGGGIANFGTVTLGNTIVAFNNSANGGNSDLQDSFHFGTTTGVSITTLGHNLIGNGDSLVNSTLADGQNGDQVGTSMNPIMPLAGPLTDNGGFTATQDLVFPSPALDAGDTSIAINLVESSLGVDINRDGDTEDTFNTVGEVPFDQRGTGFSRIQENPDDPDGVATIDIGAFELQECFLAGTLILTEAGEKPVEELVIGDRLQTLSSQIEPIKWIGQQTYHRATAHPLRSNPIHIKPGALGDNLPQRDLFISPDHALLVDSLLINAGALANGTSIVQIQPEEDSFTYYHIELKHHALLIAEGTAAESYLPQKHDRTTFDNAEEYTALYPEQTLISYLPMNYPRISSKRQLPRFVAKRLEKRGRSLYPNAVHHQPAHQSAHQSA